ncbi:MAG: DNA mismatch endonuclease Vsr [Chloroflexi bacterium]|nr:DNA mismatch endonuclease Vsr [Chloroflexota bacterium]
MSRIRGGNTKPERLVRSMLHSMGYRFRLHRKDLPGRPDIVLPGRRTVVLVHGCYWHRHPGCRFAYTPKSNIDFWNAKFAENVKRDQRQYNQLRELGWAVITVWECETKELTTLAERLSSEIPAPSGPPGWGTSRSSGDTASR